MKPFFILIFSLLVMILTSGCKKVYPDGPAIRENRNVSRFRKIETTFSAHVEYRKSPDIKVEVLAAENIQQYVIAEVIGDRLILRTPSNISLKRGSVTVYVTAPELDGITLTGSGNFTAVDPIDADALTLDLSGSGDITISELGTSSLKARISGNGNITINSGNSGRQEVSVTGSGDYNAQQLETEDAIVKLTGSGDARVWVRRKLDATITGSGDIRYAGTPEVNASVTGSGSVKRL
ncbi:head GIN domain-containing protein [Niabella beijingensis]|uniref:head GIN domain-containing protein n=1 Tax=Niabella beijingensis TaxID=2872700 RepID=UPI001CC098A6|nr:head GIN domain-containing protein [Niabella beijingensis]MBZ4190934.1 DUF2807 domain-containing protein [Niabella beijingensis]